MNKCLKCSIVALNLLFALSLWGQGFDQAPIFEGCNDPLISGQQQVACSNKKIAEYIAKNLQYPDSAVSNKVEGVVLLRFTVDEKGTVTIVELLKGLDRDCNQEALRVVRSLPQFSPALLNKKPVTAQLTVPIRFRLENLLEDINDTKYQLHWGKLYEDRLSIQTLDSLKEHIPFIRDFTGKNYPLERIELTYIRRNKIESLQLNNMDDWTSENEKLFKHFKAGGVLVMLAKTNDEVYQTIEVVREFQIVK